MDPNQVVQFGTPRKRGRPRNRPPEEKRPRPVTPGQQRDQPGLFTSSSDPSLEFLPHENSLQWMASSLWQIVQRSKHGVLDLNEASLLFGTHKRRRMYDFTSILLGAGVLCKKSSHIFQWMNTEMKVKLDQTVQMLVDQEKNLDGLIEAAREQIYQMFEDGMSERFLYLSYEDVMTAPGFHQEQTVIVVKAPPETVLEMPPPAESSQLHLKSTQGPIHVYLCSEDHAPSDVPEDRHDDDESTDDTDDTDDSDTEPQSFLNNLSRDTADESHNATMEHMPPFATGSFSPSPSPLTSPPPASHSSPSSEGEEETQSFATLTTPLALSLGGEEYLLSLGEDEGISDPFSSIELEGSVWPANLTL